MRVIIDSDVLIEVLRNRDASISDNWRKLSQLDVVLLYSPISEAELWAGVRPKEEKALARLFESLQCVPLDSEIARRAGGYLLEFRKSHGLHLADALIAASASVRRALLWTRNRKHYPMKSLKLFENASDTLPQA